MHNMFAHKILLMKIIISILVNLRTFVYDFILDVQTIQDTYCKSVS